MKYLVRQKVFSFGDKFTIKDENERDCFQVEGKVFSLGAKLTLFDMNGTQLYYIEQKLMKLLPEYHLYAQDSVAAICKQKFSFLGSKFDIQSPIGSFTLEGRPMNYNFELFKDNKLVAVIDKKFFAFSDSYGVDIIDDVDHGLILSLVIIIDQAIHHNNNH